MNDDTCFARGSQLSHSQEMQAEKPISSDTQLENYETLGDPCPMNDESDLKVAINTFVWERAPGAMSLSEAEKLSVRIFELFIAVRQLYGEAKRRCD